MLHTLKKICAALRVAKLLHIFSHHALCGAVWALHFKFASYAYVVIQLLLFHPKTAPKVISEGLKSNIFLGGHVPQVPNTPSVRASFALCDQSHAHWNPPFQNPRSATGNGLHVGHTVGGTATHTPGPIHMKRLANNSNLKR